MNCKDCQKAKAMMEKLLREQDSVFDAVSEMDEFVRECGKNCNGKSVENHLTKSRNCDILVR